MDAGIARPATEEEITAATEHIVKDILEEIDKNIMLQLIGDLQKAAD
jgi:hypothetical protein